MNFIDKNYSQILDYNVLGNSCRDLLFSLLLLVSFLIIFKIIQKVILKKLSIIASKTKTTIDDTIIEVVKNIRPGFYVFLSFYLSTKRLHIGSTFQSIINWILIIWVTYVVIIALQKILDYFFERKIKSESGNSAEALRTLSAVARGILWTIGVLFILSNLGINITSVFAGLGIGGIAVALALQNILTDLFSSFAIYFDKPFEVGDFIIVGDKVGVVEKIGIKTTRMKALQGEEIVISNKELTSSQVQNFKKLEKRRIAFNFGVRYETTNEQLLKIKKICENIFQKIDIAKLDRCHFYSFDNSALTFEVVYFISSPDYNEYMDTQEVVNLELKAQLEKAGIKLAFPVTMVHLINSKE